MRKKGRYIIQSSYFGLQHPHDGCDSEKTPFMRKELSWVNNLSSSCFLTLLLMVPLTLCVLWWCWGCCHWYIYSPDLWLMDDAASVLLDKKMMLWFLHFSQILWSSLRQKSFLSAVFSLIRLRSLLVGCLLLILFSVIRAWCTDDDFLEKERQEDRDDDDQSHQFGMKGIARQDHEKRFAQQET